MPGCCPFWRGQFDLPTRAVAHIDKPHILAAISNCSLVKENCMPPQGRNAGSGMVAKSPSLSTPLLERIFAVDKLPRFGTCLPDRKASQSSSSKVLMRFRDADDDRDDESGSHPIQKFSGLRQRGARGPDIVHQKHRMPSHDGFHAPAASHARTPRESLPSTQTRLPRRSTQGQRVDQRRIEHPGHRSSEFPRVVDSPREPPQQVGRHRHHAPATEWRDQSGAHLPCHALAKQRGDPMPRTTLETSSERPERRVVSTEAHEGGESRRTHATIAGRPLPHGDGFGHGPVPTDPGAASHAPQGVRAKAPRVVHHARSLRVTAPEHGGLEQVQRVQQSESPVRAR